MDYIIRAKVFSDNDALAEAMLERWHTVSIISRARRHYTLELDGFVAIQESRLLGFALYQIEGNQCEIIVLQSLAENQGIGTALIHAVLETAKQHGCARVWLVTTNDNIHALRYYQKRGFVLAAIHTRAMDVSRSIEVRIPLIGHDGIPLRDEIEFEYIIE